MNIEQIIIDSDDNGDNLSEQEGFFDDSTEVKIEESDFPLEVVENGLLIHFKILRLILIG